MIIVLQRNIGEEEIIRLNQWLQSFGVQTSPIVGAETSVIGLVGDTSVLDPNDIMGQPGVEKVIKVQEPFKKANRKFHPEDTVIKVGEDIEIGGRRIVLQPSLFGGIRRTNCGHRPPDPPPPRSCCGRAFNRALRRTAFRA